MTVSSPFFNGMRDFSETYEFMNFYPMNFSCMNFDACNYPILLGGLSLHLNHLIGSGVANYDWQFGTLPFRIFWSNLDTMGLETYPRTYSGHF